LQIAAGHVFENDVVENRPRKIPRRAMAQTADDIRMTDPIERDRLILKVLDKRPLKVVIEIVMKKNVKAFYDYELMRRLLRCDDIAGQKHLGVAASPEEFASVVSLVNSAILEGKLSHSGGRQDKRQTSSSDRKYDSTKQRFAE
jgi:hypothetical protein